METTTTGTTATTEKQELARLIEQLRSTIAACESHPHIPLQVFESLQLLLQVVELTLLYLVVQQQAPQIDVG